MIVDGAFAHPVLMLMSAFGQLFVLGVAVAAVGYIAQGLRRDMSEIRRKLTTISERIAVVERRKCPFPAAQDRRAEPHDYSRTCGDPL